MDSNLKLLCTVLAGASFIFAGCSEDNDSPVENITIVEEGNVTPVKKAESDQPTAILGSGGSMSQLLSQTFLNIVDADKAKHVIVACGDMDTYKEELQSAYKRGAVITIADPDPEKDLDEWCDQNGMVFPADPTALGGYSLISFNRKASSMTVQKSKKMTDVIIDEGEVPLVIFTGWLDKLLTPTLKGPDFRSKDIKKRFTPQHVSHVFSIDLPKDVLEQKNWTLPENVSLSTTAEFNCDIYPLHSFADNASFTGDLYVVEADLTIHNGDLYNGRWQYTRNNGSWIYEVCGFYLSEYWLGAKLLEKGSYGLVNSTGHQLAGGPAPSSTPASSSLQGGFEWKFDGWLTGGSGLESATPTPIQEGGWTWNNMTSDDATGLKVETSSGIGNPKWLLAVDGLPYNKSIPLPDIATGDLTFHCSWVWAVPQAVDNSTGHYYMNVDLGLRYTWNWTLVKEGTFEKDDILRISDCSHSFMLIPPSRAEGQRI